MRKPVTRNEGRIYARRVAGGHHDHRHPDCAVAAGRAGGPRGGAADAVQEQPQATRPGLPGTRTGQPAVPGRRLGLGLDRRPRSGQRPAPAGRMALQRPAVHRAAGRCTTWGPDSSPGTTRAKMSANLQRVVVALNCFYCPTRRPVLPCPYPPSARSPPIMNAGMPPYCRPQRLRRQRRRHADLCVDRRPDAVHLGMLPGPGIGTGHSRGRRRCRTSAPTRRPGRQREDHLRQLRQDGHRDRLSGQPDPVFRHHRRRHQHLPLGREGRRARLLLYERDLLRHRLRRQ